MALINVNTFFDQNPWYLGAVMSKFHVDKFKSHYFMSNKRNRLQVYKKHKKIRQFLLTQICIYNTRLYLLFPEKHILNFRVVFMMGPKSWITILF